MYQKAIRVIPVFYPCSSYHAYFSIPPANGFHISCHTHPICTTIICVPFMTLWSEPVELSSGKGTIKRGVGMLCPSAFPQSELELFLLAPGSDKNRVKIHFRCNIQKFLSLHRFCPAQCIVLRDFFQCFTTLEIIQWGYWLSYLSNTPEECFDLL